MAKCATCNGTGKEKYYGEMTIIYSTCKECGGSGSDKKPYCLKHKRSMEYSGAVGWHCRSCRDEWSIGYANTH